MSRRPQHQPPIDTTQPEVPEDELLSATGEGDEVMEEAEEQEGYSACQTLSHKTYSNHVRYPSPLSYRPCVTIPRTPTDAFPIASSHSSASSTPTSSLTWISWFCSLPGHDYFCEVAEDFIEDDFNLTGLNAMVPFWKEAMEMVLDVEPGAFPPTPELSSISLPNDLIDEDSAKIPDVSIVEASAELLYGLVHQRYVLTRAGLHAMVSEFIILVVIMNSNVLRRKSTKLVYLARVRACIVWAAMLSHVGDQTYRDWRQ
jgi:casein kinase II subunit beta